MPDQPTQALIARSKNGDREGFAALVRHHQGYVFSVALRILCNEDEAEDIVQETFIRVWRHIHRYDERVLFTTWLYRIVTNLCLDRIRSLRRRRILFRPQESAADDNQISDAAGPEEIHSNRQLADWIRSLTKDLPTTQHIVFVLRDLQELSIEETSAVTGLSAGSIKTNLHYARRRIRELLAQRYGVEEA